MSDKKEIAEAQIVAYLNKELSVAEVLAVDEWVAASAENFDQFMAIKKAWEVLGDTSITPVAVDTDKAWNTVLNKINAKNTPVIPLHEPKTGRRKFLLMAAGFAVLIGLTTILFWPNKITPDLELTAQNKVVHQRLSDGSEITLNKNSVLTYPAEFETNERRVKLTGEAFFEIERDEEKPFVVELYNDYYVKVLGTSFNIKSINSDTTTEVYVKTGKVEFGTSTNKLILEAGEKGVLNNETGELQKITDGLSQEVETFWMDQHIIFESTPLHKVVDRLNGLYDDEVILDCAENFNEPINSEFKGQTLLEILEVIVEVHHLEIIKEERTSNWRYTLKCND